MVEEPEPVVAVEMDGHLATEGEEGAAAAMAPAEPVTPAAVEDQVAAPVSLPVSEEALPLKAEAEETQTGGRWEDEEAVGVAPEPDAEATAEELEAVVRAMVRAMMETEEAGGDDAPKVAEVPAVRRSEFDVPVTLDSRPQREVSHPSGGVPDVAVAEPGQAGDPEAGLLPRTVPGTLRGVMGYRLPLVSRQEVPDQIVSGVLIPAHTTFVILREGSWELVDVSAEEVERLREVAASRDAEVAEPTPENNEGWAIWRIFRKRQAPEE